jgi:DNA-directed RNA polymerase beta' subunit
VTCRETYFTCPGHFGHIELPAPVFHPLFMNHMYNLLRTTCLFCHHFKLSRPEVRVTFYHWVGCLTSSVAQSWSNMWLGCDSLTTECSMQPLLWITCTCDPRPRNRMMETTSRLCKHSSSGCKSSSNSTYCVPQAAEIITNIPLYIKRGRTSFSKS